MAAAPCPNRGPTAHDISDCCRWWVISTAQAGFTIGSNNVNKNSAWVKQNAAAAGTAIGGGDATAIGTNSLGISQSAGNGFGRMG